MQEVWQQVGKRQSFPHPVKLSHKSLHSNELDFIPLKIFSHTIDSGNLG
jgi:hypothetical protein